MQTVGTTRVDTGTPGPHGPNGSGTGRATIIRRPCSPCSLFPRANYDVVVVAASLGGPTALATVLGALPADFPAPIFVAQHVGAHPSRLPELLGRHLRLAVRHAADGERLRAGTVYVAPPDRHLLVVRDDGPGGTMGGAVCRLSDGPPVQFARPAADPLFAAAAAAFGPRALGVVLTGCLQDGAAGAAAVRRAGGRVLVQDPATCRAPDMPRAAVRAHGADLVLPPAALSAALVALVCVPGAPALFGLEADAHHAARAA